MLRSNLSCICVTVNIWFQLALKCGLSLSIASFIRQTEITNQSNSHINIPFILCPFCDTWMSTHNIQRSTQCEKRSKNKSILNLLCQVPNLHNYPCEEQLQELETTYPLCYDTLNVLDSWSSSSPFSGKFDEIKIVLSSTFLKKIELGRIEEYLCLEGHQSTLYSSNIYSPMKLKTIYFMW